MQLLLIYFQILVFTYFSQSGYAVTGTTTPHIGNLTQQVGVKEWGRFLAVNFEGCFYAIKSGKKNLKNHKNTEYTCKYLFCALKSDNKKQKVS